MKTLIIRFSYDVRVTLQMLRNSVPASLLLTLNPKVKFLAFDATR